VSNFGEIEKAQVLYRTKGFVVGNFLPSKKIFFSPPGHWLIARLVMQYPP